MAWFTTTDAANRILRDYSEIDNYGFTYNSGGWVLQVRVISTYVYEYIGIDEAYSVALVSALRSTSGTTDCRFQSGEGGSGSIIHTLQTYGAWTTVT